MQSLSGRLKIRCGPIFLLPHVVLASVSFDKRNKIRSPFFSFHSVSFVCVLVYSESISVCSKPQSRCAMQAGGPLSTSDAASEDHTRAHDNASDDGDSINSFKASVGVSTQEREGIATSATMDPTKQLPPQPGMPYIQRARPQIRLSPSYTKPAKAGYLSKYAGVNYQRRFFVLRYARGSVSCNCSLKSSHKRLWLA